MKRGQISVEFTTVFGFVFLMMIPLIIIFFDQAGDIQDSVSENHLRNVGIKIADKAETVYYLGEPSKTTLKVSFPEHIENIQISGRSIIFSYRTATNKVDNMEIVSLVNVTGTLSPKAGIHYIQIEASGDEVSISE
jgi:hypothetical protein